MTVVICVMRRENVGLQQLHSMFFVPYPPMVLVDAYDAFCLEPFLDEFGFSFTQRRLKLLESLKVPVDELRW